MASRNQTNRILIALLMLLISGMSACTAGSAPATVAPAAESPEPTSIPAATVAPTEPIANESTLPASTPLATSPEPSTAIIRLQDSRGRDVSLAKPAERIVSLAPSNTEILFALGAGAQVVGRDAFSDYPEQAKAVVDIGGGFGELNMEVILAQKPDLVLAASLTADEQITALEDAGITVFAVANPKDFDGLYANLRSLGMLTNRTDAAETLVADIQARVKAVDSKLAGISQRPLVFYEIDATDPNAIYTPGPGSFVDMLITRAGGQNIGADLEGEWPKISLEALIARQPELILLGDAYWGNQTVEMAKSRSGWDALQVVKQDKIYPFDDNLVSRPGPRLVAGLEALAKLFHPELFQ